MTKQELFRALRASLARKAWLVAGAVLLALLVSLATVAAVTKWAESDHRDWLASEARRQAIELMGQTLNGKVMGSMNVLGLVIPEVKMAAISESTAGPANIPEMLAAIGNSYGADGVFIVGTAGKISASWDSLGRSNVGLDVKFRSYFQMAMQGKENVYAAVSISTGDRVLYFSAPVFANSSPGSKTIGAAVARVDLAQVNALLGAWHAPAALLTPQGVVFAANRDDWLYRLAGHATPERAKEIRALKQFGKLFEQRDPASLPVDVEAETAPDGDMRLAIEKVPVNWNDPGGAWSLVLTSDLRQAISVTRQWLIGGGAFVFALLLQWLAYSLMLNSQQREASLQALQANIYAERERAQLQKHLATISMQLQQQESLDGLAGAFLTAAAFRFGMRQGACYLADADTARLRLLAAYACGDGHVTPAELAFGEGPLGQCAVDKKPISLSPPAASAWKIVSGLGQMAPTELLIAPIILNDTVQAVVELALLKPLAAGKRQLLDEMLPLLALNIEIKRHQSSAASA